MSAEFPSLGSMPLALLGTALLFAAAHGAGEALTLLGGRWAGAVHAPLLRTSAGLSIVAALGVAFGQAGWLGGRSSLVMLATLALLNGRTIFSRRFALHRRRASLGLQAVAIVLGLITLGPALCPPTGWDELVYHHELPRRWLTDGQPAFYSDLAYSGFPSLGEILFWLVAPLEGVIAPRLIVWVCWIIAMALIFQLLRRLLAPNSALVLTLVFAASGAILMISANCYVESILLLNCAAILHVIVIPQRLRAGQRVRAPAVLLGVLAGGAAAVKLTGIVIVVLPCLWYLLAAYRLRRRAPLGQLALFLTVAAVVSVPFYLRPWLATGNPCYPFFAEHFTSDPAQLDTSRYHHALGAAAFGRRGLTGFLSAPLSLALANDLYDGDFGLQLLVWFILAGLSLSGLTHVRGRWLTLWLSVSLLVLYGFWFATAQQARFAVPAVLILLLLAARGLQRLRGAPRQAALCVVIAAALVGLPWPTAGLYVGSWFTAVKLVPPTAYVNELTDRRYLPLVEAVRERTPADAKLLLLFEHRGFYLSRRCAIGTPVYQAAAFSPPEEIRTAEQIMEVLRRERITHVVMTNAPAGPDQAPGWFDRLEPFLLAFSQAVRDGRLRIVWQTERYLLLEVRPQHSAEPR